MMLAAIITAMDDFLSEHKNVYRLLQFLQKEMSLDEFLLVTKVDGSDFYKIMFNCQISKRCPFSIWIERSSEEVIFLNIGKEDQEAVVLHYWDISSQDSLEETRLIIKRMLSSSVKMTKTYCRKKLKKVSYNAEGHKYTHYIENMFFCFNKKKVFTSYEPWIFEK